MSDTRSWLASRHLRRTPQGARAVAAMERLPPERQAVVGDRGDALAAVSVSLAHSYFIAAVDAHGLAGDEGAFWEAGAAEILGDDAAGRTAAAAYFALDPRQLARAPRDVRRAWCAAAAALRHRSQRLATTFIDSLGRQLIDAPDEVGNQAVDAIDAWRRAAENVLEAARWRGEFLAARFLESAPSLGPRSSAAAVAAWATVFAEIGRAGRAARCPLAPPELSGLDPRLGERVLQAIAAHARSDARGAEELLARLPPAAAALPPAAATALAEATLRAAPQPRLSDAIGMLSAAARGLDDATLDMVLAHAVRIADRSPHVLADYLRSADRALEEGGPDGLALWVDHGLELAVRNEKAGVAHFKLESRTSHKVLVEHGTAVRFDEIDAVMQRYALMIARRSLHLAAGGGVWLRPPISAPEDRVVRLPERIDLFDTSEENQVFFKLAVAHAAARWQYGTYDFSLEVMRVAGISPAAEPAGDDIVALLDSFPNPLLAAGLFLVLDGARVDACLARDFPGLASDLDRLGPLYARLPVPAADRTPETLVEALFLMTVGRVPANGLPPRLRASGRSLEPVVVALRAPAATVYDSVKILFALYRSLSLAAVVAPRDDDLSTFLEIGGATVIDPLEHLDGGDAPPSASAARSADGDADVEIAGEPDDPKLRLEMNDDAPAAVGGIPLSPEEIRKLIEQGVDLRISEGRGQEQASLGLYITELLGKLPAESIERLRRMVAEGDAATVRAWLAAERGKDFHFYDEWDYQIGDYRRRWCRLSELEVEGDGGRYVGGVLTRVSDLIVRIRREFSLMRPEQFRKVRGMEDGEDFDFNALVDAHADRRTRWTRSDRFYVARRREERDVATLFLIDMSASTDEPVERSENGHGPEGRRVIDITKDTLVVMSAVLHEIGDAYAIYGFSGHGRENVEYYHVKTFGERWGPTVRGRLGGIEPKRSTRMGAALRHAARKLAAVPARARHLLLLSDGFPQDYDYGEDRRSNVYGIRDTMTALQEVEAQGVKTFCITVDPAGHDYLKDMCPPTRYAVIEDIEALPEELPRIYRTVTRY